jgi:hypothetical protein
MDTPTYQQLLPPVHHYVRSFLLVADSFKNELAGDK